MKSRGPLALMEQLAMVLVFALAAALCLQAFALSDRLSRSAGQRDRAMVEAQNTAELVKSQGGGAEEALRAASDALGGTFSGGGFVIDYDGDWNRAGDAMRYTLGVSQVESGVPGLARAELWVRDEAQDQELLRFQVAWQTEVDDHE